MPDKHLKYGGSTMARTLNCPAWQFLSRDIPRGGSNSFADEGTLLHNCMEEMFVDIGVTPKDMLEEGREYNGIELTEALVEDKLLPALKGTIDLLIKYGVVPEEGTAQDLVQFKRDIKANVMCEPFVELIEGLAGGSIDMLAVSKDGKTVIVFDYKFGFNPVDVEENPQALFYALCADVDPATLPFTRNAEKLVSVIIQPTEENVENNSVANVWEADIDVLSPFEDRVYKAIDAAEASDGTDTCAGSWCKYCPASGVCPEKTGAAAAALRLDPAVVENLEKALPLADQLEQWIKDVRKLAHEQMEAGVKVKGFKLVQKRASRVWNDEEAVETKVKNMRKIKTADAHTSKLLSPAQMEKLFKREGVDFNSMTSYISSVSSGTTLAPESDKRPEALPTLALKALANRL